MNPLLTPGEAIEVGKESRRIVMEAAEETARKFGLSTGELLAALKAKNQEAT